MKHYFKKILVFFALICFGLGLGMQTIEAFSAPITSPFGMRFHPIRHKWLPHEGVDLGVDENAIIPSPASGTVIIVGDRYGGYGIEFVIQEDKDPNIFWRIAHNNAVLVNVGDHVAFGQNVVLAGSTGGSTGVHLHIERRIGGEMGTAVDPVPFLRASGWDISGEIGSASNLPDDGVFGKLRKIIPKIDFDYTTYFSPSERLLEATHKIIEVIKNSFDRWQPAILNLLYSLMVIDLAWFACQCALKGELPFTELFPKIIRYGFFIMLAKEWKKIIDNMFIPFFENISSTMTGNEHTVETFLNFSTLYDTVKHIMANNMHPEVNLVEAWYQMFPFIILNILNWVILFIIIGLMLWVMYKVIAFYMVCSFGILGIPINFIPKIGNKGNMMIGVIISTLFDLILTAILLNLLNSQLQTLGVISANNVPDVFMFVGVFFFLALFTTKLSEACSNFFSGLL